MEEVNPYHIFPTLKSVPGGESRFPKSRIGLKKTLFAILGFLFLAGSAFAGVFLVQNQQIFSEKAASGTAVQKIAEIAKEVGQTATPSMVNYSSSNLGYRINFDKNYWTPANSTDLTKSDLKNISFSLNGNAGKAQIQFKAFTLKAIPQTKTDNLDVLAQNLSASLRPTSKKRIRMDGRDFYEFTYESSFLNQKSQYFDYITINGDNYYVITVKYSTFGNSREFVQGLLNSFQFPPSTPVVKGIGTDTSPVTALDESKIVELTKPSVVEIAHLYCNDINIPNLGEARFLKSNYTFCDGSLGSGFIINKDGYIGTNGHVVKNYPETALVQALSSGSQSIKPFAVDLIQEIQLQLGQEISSEQAEILLGQVETDPTAFQSFMSLIYKMLQQNVAILKENQNKYFVKLGSDPLIVDTTRTGTAILGAITPSNTIMEAELIDFNFPNAFTVDAILNGKAPVGSDVAIIKITDAPDLVFPSVKLGGSESLKEGSDVIVIGYPGIASGDGSGTSLVDLRSSATPTVTRGIISAIKNDQGGLKLIQVDASIDHGNSGGPAFDTLGQVIGIATYGLGSTSGNYNFLRDIEDLKKLANGIPIETATSPTYEAWANGLSFFWIEHYRQAEIPFGQVEKDYPIHSLVASYITDADTAIQKGQDRSGLIFLLLNDRNTQIWTASISLGLIIFVVTLAVVFRKRRERVVTTPTVSYQMPQVVPPSQQTP